MRSFFFPTASGKPAVDVAFRVKLDAKISHMWIGAYWQQFGNCLDLWICLIPFVPIHFYWRWHDPEQ